MDNVFQINDNTWRIEDAGIVRFFVLTGDTEAFVIDCGCTISNALDIVRTITDLPVKLFLTHTDGDHMASLQQFDAVYLHESEKEYLPEGQFECHFIGQDDIIDPGNRPIKVLHIPGHTPGSLAFLDINARVLFSGDTVQNSNIFMFGPKRNMSLYIDSLHFLEQYASEFDEIYPSHGDALVMPEIIGKLAAAAEGVVAGKYEKKPVDVHGNKVFLYHVGFAGFFMEK